jgi:xanthine dehydrogenase accessory factor
LLELYTLLKESLDAGELVAVATVVVGSGVGRKLLIWPDGRTAGGLGAVALDAQVQDLAGDLLVDHRSARQTLNVAGELVDVFVEVHPPPPRLVVVGAVHIAIPLVTLGNELGFRTIVVDARSAFATEDRFAHADELILKWPSKALEEMELDEASYVVVLTHDEKLDNPALKTALASRARYIGALGSTQTHAGRVEKLLAQGVTEEQLARIHAPIGLELGAERPEEIAVAIIAEIVAVSHGVGSKQPRSMTHRFEAGPAG